MIDMQDVLTLNLKCLLTDDEKMERGAALAEHVQAIEVLNEEKKASAATFKTKIDIHTLEASGLSTALHDGYEYRAIKCTTQKNYETRTITVIRTDTGEFVETRPLEIHEMQARLFDDDANAPAYDDRHNGKITVLGK